MCKEDFSEIKELARQIQALAKQASLQFAVELNTIIVGGIKDEKTIKNLLDRMLDFANHDIVLEQYKELCRYYLPINPQATSDYIYTYRDLWDSEEKEEENDE